MLDILEERIYNEQAFRDGRLAQLVAHPLDVREVTSSSLVSSTTIEKSELRSNADGVRISCFYRSCQTYVIINVWMGSDLKTLQAFFIHTFAFLRWSVYDKDEGG